MNEKNRMKLSTNQAKLFDFITIAHGSQKRKYTNQPYWIHPYQVAEICSPYISKEIQYGIEVSLLHDIVEDTNYTLENLYWIIRGAGYDDVSACFILGSVFELTDVFTTEHFPYLNRSIRKKCEAARLSTICVQSALVKCADLISNTGSIVDNDPDFARVYLSEKADVLDAIKPIVGDFLLFDIATKLMLDSWEKLGDKT